MGNIVRILESFPKFEKILNQIQILLLTNFSPINVFKIHLFIKIFTEKKSASIFLILSNLS
jgi:hypothetical protein